MRLPRMHSLSSLPLVQARRMGAAVAVVAAAAAGCGSGSPATVTPSAYVKSICTAVGPFEKDVLTRSSSLDLSTIKNPRQGKQELTSFLSAISGDTDRAVSQLRSAGTPNVKNGKQISTAIVGAFGQLQTAMHRAVTQANALPTDSDTAFKNAADTLGTDVRNSMSSIGTNLSSSTLKSSELQDAAANSPACKSLGT